MRTDQAGPRRAGPDRRLSVAPMMDVTDRHCRHLLRLISRHVLLYSEMVTTAALLHGDVDRHLRFHPIEHPVALQLGGSEADDLAACARLAARYGYDEVNLNVGCPSERVLRGAFGACLMAEPALVTDCVKAMLDAVDLPVTVKHRIGIGRTEDYGFVRDFIGRVAEAGCTTFIVHARNAILAGLSPKQNREIPPLRHDFVHALKREFPALEIITNGGITHWDDIHAQLAAVDGVMLGRAVWNDPWLLVEADERVFGDAHARPGRAAVVRAYAAYAAIEIARGTHLRHVAQRAIALYHGRPAARHWRRTLSDSRALARNDPALLLEALDAVEAASAA